MLPLSSTNMLFSNTDSRSLTVDSTFSWLIVSCCDLAFLSQDLSQIFFTCDQSTPAFLLKSRLAVWRSTGAAEHSFDIPHCVRIFFSTVFWLTNSPALMEPTLLDSFLSCSTATIVGSMTPDNIKCADACVIVKLLPSDDQSLGSVGENFI